MIVAAVLVFMAIMTAAIIGCFVGLPAMPTEISSIIDFLTAFLVGGVKVMNVFCYPAVVVPCLAFRIALEAAYKVYQLTMWTAKKVPMWGVD